MRHLVANFSINPNFFPSTYRIWSFSSFYVERLKTVEITLTGLEEVTVVVNEFEQKLAAYDSMPSDMENLRKAHDDLMTLEAEIQDKQVCT